MKNILITGGAGFIGSHVVRHFVTQYPHYQVVNLDALTYAGRLENLRDIERAANYTFIEGSICDAALLARVFADHDIDTVVNLAAESHVDRSIGGPTLFAQTNVMGTLALLEAARAHWTRNPKRENGKSNDFAGGLEGGLEGGTKNFEGKRFYQISTDEVYGALGEGGLFTEESRYDPHSPYSASKAAADHFVRAYRDTYGMPTLISNCTNNYGPGQFPEKLIPLIINNIAAEKPLPVYGDGTNVRDWIWVGDHVAAIDAVLHRGVAGETYLVGGGNEVRNIDLVRTLIRLVDSELRRAEGASERLIEFVEDRAGHDFRYAADISKIQRELGWQPSVDFDDGLLKTVRHELKR